MPPVPCNGRNSWEAVHYDGAYSVQQTTDGSYIVACYSNSSGNGTLAGILSYGGTDAWVIKLDRFGNPF
jgi:hypothetical protein